METYFAIRAAIPAAFPLFGGARPKCTCRFRICYGTDLDRHFIAGVHEVNSIEALVRLPGSLAVNAILGRILEG